MFIETFHTFNSHAIFVGKSNNNQTHKYAYSRTQLYTHLSDTFRNFSTRIHRSAAHATCKQCVRNTDWWGFALCLTTLAWMDRRLLLLLLWCVERISDFRMVEWDERSVKNGLLDVVTCCVKKYCDLLRMVCSIGRSSYVINSVFFITTLTQTKTPPV